MKIYLLTALIVIAGSANGSLTTYDAKNHLPSAALLENNITTNTCYQYNPDGIRTQATEDSVEIWDSLVLKYKYNFEG